MIAFPLLALGQDNRIAVLEVPLDELSPKQQLLGEPILLKLREDARAPRDFHVRLFRGTKNQLLKWPADRDGCIEFSTIVLRATVNGSVHLRSLDDRGWLSNHGRDAENYTLVFESGQEVSESKIRIHRSQIQAYFSVAFSMTLVPRQRLTEAIERAVQANVTATERKVEQTFSRIPAGPCRRAVEVEPVKWAANQKKRKRTFETAVILALDHCGSIDDSQVPVSTP